MMVGQQGVLVSNRVLVEDDGGSLVVRRGGVAFRDGKIIGVRTADSAEAAGLALSDETGMPVQNLGDLLIAPAFVNAHTHVAMSYFRGFVVEDTTRRNMIEDLFYHVESRATEEDVRAFTRMGAYECLLSGVGFIWDHYYFGNAVADGLVDAGLGGVVAVALQDIKGPGVVNLDRFFGETEELAQSKRLADAGVFAAVGPHATDTVSPELWVRCADMSRRLGIPLHAHFAQSFEEYDYVQRVYGCSAYELLERLGVFETAAGMLLVHGIYLSDGDLSRLARKRARLVYCPFSQMIFQNPAQVMAWERAGVKWAVATDCVASNDSMNVQKELRYVAGLPNQAVTYSGEAERFLREGGIEAARAVHAARKARQEEARAWAEPEFLWDKVTTAADGVHPGLRVGRLAPGYLANIAVWDTDHPAFWPDFRVLRGLTMGDTGGALWNLMVSGRWIGAGGDFRNSILESAEFRTALGEARERLQALLKRL